MIEPENNDDFIICESSVIESNSTYIFYKILLSNSYDIGQKVQSFLKEFSNFKRNEDNLFYVFH